MKNNLSIDELLQKATDTHRSRLRVENNANVQKYIERMNIQPGTTAVPTCVIFYHYRMIYDMTHEKAKCNKTVFFRTFNKRFPSTRKNKQRYYLLNDNFIQLTEELIEAARTYDAKYWQKKAKALRLPRQKRNDKD